MSIVFSPPDWLKFNPAVIIDEPKDQLNYAIWLSRQNVNFGTGGPFGAAVFNGDGGLLGVGVNRVVPGQCSILHAEAMAIMAAQAYIERHDLGTVGKCVLVTSCEPCCMCFGIVLWSGLSKMVYGATSADAEAIGFDEGPKVIDWQVQLRSRGIEVLGPILRTQASQVLSLYADEHQGEIYNPQATKQQ